MRRTLLLLLPVLVFVALLTAACGGGSSKLKSVPQDDVAVVGNQDITRTSFDDLLAQAKNSAKAQKQAFPKPGTSAYTSLQDRAIAYLVQRAEFEQRAKDLGISVSGEQIDAKLKQVEKQQFAGSESKFTSSLKAQGVTVKQYRDYLQQQLLSQAVYKKITGSVKVTDADLQLYYVQHKTQYTQPESRPVRHILVKTKALADQLYTQLQGGADFTGLVKKYTTDAGSKNTGGKYTDTKGSFDPTFEKTAFSLRTKEISKPIHTRFGWHIIQALGPIKAQKTTSFAQVKASLKTQLLDQKKSTVANAWVSDMSKEFCSGKIAYQQGYRPAVDPCKAATSSTSTAASTPTTTTG